MGKVQILAETAVNIAISQVHDATVLAGENRYAWASQPGMIRLYNQAGINNRCYKLYSWDNMVTDTAFQPFDAAEQVPATWNASPAIFTNLNAAANGVFPILDYDKAKTLGVEGLSLDAASKVGTGNNPAPMPVKWLYVLADGSIHPPDANGSSGTKAVVAAATEANPIVGRIAFWTDDETCKININTAAVGKSSSDTSSTFPFAAASYNSFWDTPRFNAPDELNMANYQPAQGEYQRYPGHPATVALNAVFPVPAWMSYFRWRRVMPSRAQRGEPSNMTLQFGLIGHCWRTAFIPRSTNCFWAFLHR